MLSEICDSAKVEMENAYEACRKHLATIRAGRAHVSLLDGVRVDYYGNLSPLGQIATVQTPDARLITVKPWEKNLLKSIEKAIMDANLGVTPQNDGEIIRIPIPPLTEDRRKEFTKQAKKRCEESKVSVRNARRDANEMLKESTKDGSIAEDEEKRGLKMIQDMTDEYISRIDEIYEKKEVEIMTV